VNKLLTNAWNKRKKLIAEGKRLRAKGYKLYVEGHELYDEGCKLGYKLIAEGDKLWDDAVTAVYGRDCKIEWEEGKCILTPRSDSITFE